MGYKLKDLKKFGFREVGEWHLGGKAKRGIKWTFYRPKYGRKGAVYAFVIGKKVKYIGIGYENLEKRMHNYAYHTGTQSANIGKKIANALKKGKAVKIYIRSTTTLETFLINAFKPEWNEKIKQK